MLIKFPAQLHNFRKTTVGDNLLSLSIAREYSDQVVDIVRKEIGTEFIVYLEAVDSKSNLNEDNTEIGDRFYHKMHALLNQHAKLFNITPEASKTILKDILKSKGKIKESTKELDLKGLAYACNVIEELMHERA